MIDALKELIELVKELPEFALWILLGYLLYKLFVVGSVYGIIKLAITKAHDYMVKPQTKVHVKLIQVGDKFVDEIAQDEFFKMMQDVIDYHSELKRASGKNSGSFETLFYGPDRQKLRRDDIVWARNILEIAYKKELRENKGKK